MCVSFYLHKMHKIYIYIYINIYIYVYIINVFFFILLLLYIYKNIVFSIIINLLELLELWNNYTY